MLLTSIVYAQKKAIRFESNKNKTITVKEQKRVKIFTTDNKVYKGRFKIIDDATIQIKDNIIPLTTINRLMVSKSIFSFLGSSALIYLGTIVFAASAIVVLFSGGAYGVPYLVGGGGVAAVGIIGLNKRRLENKYGASYRIVTLE